MKTERWLKAETRAKLRIAAATESRGVPSKISRPSASHKFASCGDTGIQCQALTRGGGTFDARPAPSHDVS